MPTFYRTKKLDTLQERSGCAYKPELLLYNTGTKPISFFMIKYGTA
jgi:hypothetical protein